MPAEIARAPMKNHLGLVDGDLLSDSVKAQ
jgi:hypothetical protein